MKTTRTFSAYGKLIMEVTKCQPDDTFQIEEAMRCRFSTLDHLDRREFAAEAKRAWRAVQELRVTDPDLFPTPFK